MLPESLTIEQALILGFAGLVALLLAVVRFRYALLFVGGMLFVSALGVPLDFSKNIIRLWILPLQAQRSTVFLAGAALLAMAACVHIGKVSFRRVSGPGLMLFGLGCYAGMVRLMSGYAEEGMQSIAFATLTIPPLLIILPSLIESWDDFYPQLRMISLVTAAWIGCVALQFVVDWKKLVVQHGLSRFHGLLANPQHAAVFLSVASATALFLALNDPKIRYRMLWAGVSAVSAILMVWTGSRTGLGMLTIGATAVLYARAGRAILFLPVAGAVGLVAYNLLSSGGMEIDIEGFTGRGDNRTQVWWRLVDEIIANPVLGIGLPKDIPSENSYLFATASFGIGMGALILLMMCVCAVQSVKLLRSKKRLAPRERRLADLVIGFYAMYFGGAMFEGYIVARVSTQLMFMLIFASIGARLLQLSRIAGEEPPTEEQDFVESDAVEGDASWYEEEHAPPPPGSAPATASA